MSKETLTLSFSEEQLQGIDAALLLQEPDAGSQCAGCRGANHEPGAGSPCTFPA